MPTYVHNPYLDGGAYGNTVDSNRVGTSALTIALNPQYAGGPAPPKTIGLTPGSPGSTTTSLAPTPAAGPSNGGGPRSGIGPGVGPGLGINR